MFLSEVPTWAFFPLWSHISIASELISNTQVRLNLVKGRLNFPIMEDYIDEVERLDLVDLLTRRPKTVRDRFDPFGFFYDEEDFIMWFPFSRIDVIHIMVMLGYELFHQQRKVLSVTPITQLLVTLGGFFCNLIILDSWFIWGYASNDKQSYAKCFPFSFFKI